MSIKKQTLSGLVYSTDPNFSAQYENIEIKETLESNKQVLKIKLDTKIKGGKVATLIEGFIGKIEDLESLAKILKTKCGCGGSAKDGNIIIQGDVKQKVTDLLKAMDYKVK